MIDIKHLRDQPDAVRASQRARGEDAGIVDLILVADAYGAQDPAVVGVELSAAAEAAAAAFAAVGAGDWQRTGRRSNGSVFTIETLGQYFLHDLTHHLHDVRG